MKAKAYRRPVVNCFQNFYLWYTDTGRHPRLSTVSCCELLSKFLSLIHWYRSLALASRTAVVVNCFQNFYLWYTDTGWAGNGIPVRLLWIAFKISIFDTLIQDWISAHGKAKCCELLSKFLSLIHWYRGQDSCRWLTVVVNCFQNFYLWYTDTGCWSTGWTPCPLWIAFKISIFDTLIQVSVRPAWTQGRLWIAFKISIFDTLIQGSVYLLPPQMSCELLSKFLSLIHWYRLSTGGALETLLWIAFKISIFDTLIQGIFCNRRKEDSCELLSKFLSLIHWYRRSG